MRYRVTAPPGGRFEPTIPTVAVLKGRADADADGMVEALVRALFDAGHRPALLWTERTDTLAPEVVTTATSAWLFPEGLREAASRSVVARYAHLGEGAETGAVRALFHDLSGCTHAVLDGRLLGVVTPHLSVMVVGDGPGALIPDAAPFADACDMEIFAPSDLLAVALVRSLNHRA